MEIRVLGPLEIVSSTGEITPVRRAKPATLLAVLVIHARAQVNLDHLLEALWGEAQPATAIKTLQTYVAQIRRLLGDERDMLTTTAAGYLLDIPDRMIDARRFEQLVRQGQEQLPSAPSAAQRGFAAALALWRGPPYSDFAFAEFARSETSRLEEVRLVAQEGRIEALLRSGRATEAVSDLQDLTRRHPLREGLWGQLLRALHASGRQAEALRAYTRVRDLLARELGVDPGPELRRIERQILAQEIDDPVDAREPVAAVTPDDALAVEQRWVTAVHLRTERGLRAQADRVRAVADRYEGRVVQLTDAAAVLAFGAPVAHDDDSERAVRCALDVCRDLGEGDVLRAGVAAGEARIDEGRPAPGGAPFGAAARLAAGAPPASVAVSDEVRHATRRTVRYHPSAVGFTAAGIATGAVTPVGRAPLIGREVELELLDTVWRLTRNTARPYLVTVVGQPGIGKSRLLSAFVQQQDPDGVTVITGACRAYGDAVFGAVADVVRGIVGLSGHEPVRDVRWRIEQWLRGFLPSDEQHRATEYLVTLLSVLGDIAEIRESTTRSLRRLLEVTAADRPTVVVFEDLHWAHPDLLALIEQTIMHTIGVPLLVVGVARPELLDARPGWGGGLPRHTALSLEPLAPGDNRALAAALLSSTGATMPEEAIDAAGGNPLFVEELIAWELEGLTDGSVPATLRSVIDARLDALPEAARGVAIDAAVIGHHFWPGAVAALNEPDIDDLRGWLDYLEGRSIVVRRPTSAMRDEPEYRFRHDLIAEVAYARVAPEQRPAKHMAVGLWLETQPGAPPSVLGRHWREAGDVDRAIQYLCAAAEQASAARQHHRAAVLYRQAMELLDPADPRRQRIVLRRAVVLQTWVHSVLDVGRVRMAEAADEVSPRDPPA